MDAYDIDNRIAELETEMRTRGLTDDDMRELQQLRAQRDAATAPSSSCSVRELREGDMIQLGIFAGPVLSVESTAAGNARIHIATKYGSVSSQLRSWAAVVEMA